MRGEHIYVSFYVSVKGSWHGNKVAGSGGRVGEDARGCQTLVEGVMSRRVIIGISSRRRGSGILIQGGTHIRETHLAVALHPP